MRFPSALNATLNTQTLLSPFVGTDRLAGGRPVPASHNRMTPTASPDTMRFPSGLNATLNTLS